MSSFVREVFGTNHSKIFNKFSLGVFVHIAHKLKLDRTLIKCYNILIDWLC